MVCCSTVLQENTNCTLGLGTGSQRWGIIDRALMRWALPLLSKASQACKPLGFARVIGTMTTEGSFNMTGLPACISIERRPL